MKNFLKRLKKTQDSPETKLVYETDDAGKEKAGRILFDELGSAFSIDWSFPQAVGQKGDSRFVGDTAVIVPEKREDFERAYGGYRFSENGSNYPLGELSKDITDQIHEVGRVAIEIPPTEE